MTTQELLNNLQQWPLAVLLNVGSSLMFTDGEVMAPTSSCLRIPHPPPLRLPPNTPVVAGL